MLCKEKHRVIIALSCILLLATGCAKTNSGETETGGINDTSNSAVAMQENYLEINPLTFNTNVRQGSIFEFDFMTSTFNDDESIFSTTDVESYVLDTLDTTKLVVPSNFCENMVFVKGSDGIQTLMFENITADIGTYVIEFPEGCITTADGVSNKPFSFTVAVISNAISPYVALKVTTSNTELQEDKTLTMRIMYQGVSGTYLTQNISEEYFEFNNCTGEVDTLSIMSKGTYVIAILKNIEITGENPSITLKEGSALDAEGNPTEAVSIAING